MMMMNKSFFVSYDDDSALLITHESENVTLE